MGRQSNIGPEESGAPIMYGLNMIQGQGVSGSGLNQIRRR